MGLNMMVLGKLIIETVMERCTIIMEILMKVGILMIKSTVKGYFVLAIKNFMKVYHLIIM